MMFHKHQTLAVVLLLASVIALVPCAPAALADGLLLTPSRVTVGPNLIWNGDFDNGVWYERFRGWSPAGWYQWFTCGDDAPEHAVGRDKPHTGKEYVRIHMWAHNWRGGIIQNVKNVEPGHWYRVTGYGWFAKLEKDPQADLRIGLDPYGRLKEQFSVDVTKHPAPPYNECVGQDPWPDIPESTVWAGPHAYYNDWGKFEVEAEACSDTVTVILYSSSIQKQDEAIYEMNWDSIFMEEIPWPTKRLPAGGGMLRASDQIDDMIINIQPALKTAQVTWRTKIPAGAAQVVYRWLNASDSVRQPAESRKPVMLGRYPFESPVVYEKSLKAHWVSIDNLNIPADAAALEAVALSRALIDGECVTLCSAPKVFEVKKQFDLPQGKPPSQMP